MKKFMHQGTMLPHTQTLNKLQWLYKSEL